MTVRVRVCRTKGRRVLLTLYWVAISCFGSSSFKQQVCSHKEESKRKNGGLQGHHTAQDPWRLINEVSFHLPTQTVNVYPFKLSRLADWTDACSSWRKPTELVCLEKQLTEDSKQWPGWWVIYKHNWPNREDSPREDEVTLSGLMRHGAKCMRLQACMSKHFIMSPS